MSSRFHRWDGRCRGCCDIDSARDGGGSGVGSIGDDCSGVGGVGPSKGKSNGNKSEICNKFNDNACRSPCPFGRAHLCSICRGTHKRDDCPRNKEMSKGKKGGKGGRGKGGKGGRK